MAASAVALTTLAAPAQAAQTPTMRELLNLCKKETDSCVFHTGSRQEFDGPRHAVGSRARNCTGVNQMHSLSWSDTTGGSNSLGVDITAGVKFGEVFAASVTMSYGHTWEWSHTTTQTETLWIPARNNGQLFRSTRMVKVGGDYELRFSSKRWGHYIWYVNNFSATSARTGGDRDAVTFSAWPMNKGELADCPKPTSGEDDPATADAPDEDMAPDLAAEPEEELTDAWVTAGD